MENKKYRITRNGAQPPSAAIQSAGAEQPLVAAPSESVKSNEPEAEPQPGAVVPHTNGEPQPGAVVPHAEGRIQAKPSLVYYRRNLPHIQNAEKPSYITFCTRDRWVLPERVRNIVIKHCLHDHGRRYWLHCVLVMPDHVHMILSAYCDAQGNPFGMAEIMSGIKGASAHSINKALARAGSVWQTESFDRILRSSESLLTKAECIWDNPVRKGLVDSRERWPWFWGEWMDIPKDVCPYFPADIEG